MVNAQPMKLIKVTFKDISDTEVVQLMDKLKELPFNNDLEIIDLDSSWKENDTAMGLYKAYKKANNTFKEFILNNNYEKHNRHTN